MIDEKGQNLGIFKLGEALNLAREKNLDLIEISASANPPVAKIISFDKFRYQKEKEKRKQQQTQKTKELKQIRISPRAALNDFLIKARQAENFLKNGHQVEINLFLRGREKFNKEWSLKKLDEFLKMITFPYQITLKPKTGGRGFVTQISPK